MCHAILSFCAFVVVVVDNNNNIFFHYCDFFFMHIMFFREFRFDGPTSAPHRKPIDYDAFMSLIDGKDHKYNN